MIARRAKLLGLAGLLAVVVALVAVAPAQAKYGFVTKWDGSGNPPAPHPFIYPHGVATDSAGNVYVADSGGDRIEKFTSNGAFITQFGGPGHGNGGFDNPLGIATDPAGNVYVADEGNFRIQKFTPSGTFITTWGDAGKFFLPQGVATDPAGNVYVADTENNRIQKFTSHGAFITKWGSAGSGNGQFSAPASIATDPAGNVYVADTKNNRIQKFTSNGTFMTKWGGSGGKNGQLWAPKGIATDPAGNVYVADAGNDRIQKFSSNGTFITQWGSEGSGNGEFLAPAGIAVDSAGNAYVADTENNRIQKFARLPVLTITSGPKGKTHDQSPSFAFRSDEPGTAFQCKLDKGPWSACSSPKAYTNLSGGKHTFRVRGIVAGNVGDVASRKFKIIGAKLPVRKLKVKHHSKAPLTIECPLATACKGKIEINARVKRKLLTGKHHRHHGRKGHHRKKGTTKIKVIHPKRYSVAPGGAEKLKLKLTKAAKKVLKHKRKLVGTGTLTAAGGEQAKFKAVLKG